MDNTINELDGNQRFLFQSINGADLSKPIVINQANNALNSFNQNDDNSISEPFLMDNTESTTLELPENSELSEFINDLLDNTDTIPIFSTLKKAVEYLQKKVADDVRKVKVDEEDIFSDMISFFKSSNLQCKIQIKLKDQPAIDTGGVLKHVFSKCLHSIIEGSSLPPFFEGILLICSFQYIVFVP